MDRLDLVPNPVFPPRTGKQQPLPDLIGFRFGFKTNKKARSVNYPIHYIRRDVILALPHHNLFKTSVMYHRFSGLANDDSDILDIAVVPDRVGAFILNLYRKDKDVPEDLPAGAGISEDEWDSALDYLGIRPLDYYTIPAGSRYIEHYFKTIFSDARHMFNIDMQNPLEQRVYQHYSFIAANTDPTNPILETSEIVRRNSLARPVSCSGDAIQHREFYLSQLTVQFNPGVVLLEHFGFVEAIARAQRVEIDVSRRSGGIQSPSTLAIPASGGVQQAWINTDLTSVVDLYIYLKP